MFLSQNLTGYIFKIYPAKIADQVVHILNAKGGRTVAFSQGSRKGSSRKGYSIDLLNFISVKLSSSKSNLPYLNEVKLFRTIRSELKTLHAMATVQVICELIDIFSLEDHEDPQLFIIIDDVVTNLKNANNILLVSALILKLLNHAGNLPSLRDDINTGETILNESQRVLSPEIGYETADSNHTISDRIYKVQQFALSNPFEQINKIKMSPEELQKILAISFQWVEYSTESALKSKDLFLKSLK